MKKFSKIVSLILCVVLAVSFCACGNIVKDTKTQAGAADLVWFLRSSEPAGFAEVEKKVNELLKEKMGITIDIQCIEPGDYGQKVQLALASGEDVDLIWTGNWGGFLYEANVSKGAFLALDDLLKNDVPELYNHYKEGVWEAATVGGKIYGVPMEQIFHSQSGYSFIKADAEELGLDQRIRDMAWVDDNTHGSMEEMEEIYDTVRAAKPADYAISVTGVFDTFGEYRSTVSNFSIVDDEVFFDYDKGLANAERAKRWNDKGYFPADIATLDNTDAYVKEGKVFSGYNRYLPGVEGKFRISKGYDVIIIPTSEAVINRGGIQSTLTAVAAGCEDPVTALKFLYLMHTDEEMLNLICYGIEGRDYELIPNTNPQRMERESGAYYISEFMVGSQFLAYLVPSYHDTVWEETKYENETARTDPYIGFSFDPSPVESYISQVSAVTTEYSKILSNGLEDPNVSFDERYEKMNLAGLDIIREEAQRQLDEWLASQE